VNGELNYTKYRSTKSSGADNLFLLGIYKLMHCVAVIAILLVLFAGMWFAWPSAPAAVKAMFGESFCGSMDTLCSCGGNETMRPNANMLSKILAGQ
jgi:hypothetical protein